jgi:hypothetical protein
LYSTSPLTGTILGTKDIPYDDVPTSADWVTWTFDTPITITADGFYGIQIGMNAPTGDNYSWTFLHWFHASDWSDADTGTPYAGKERGYTNSVSYSYWTAGDNIAYKINCTDCDGNVAETPTTEFYEGDCDPGLGIRTYLFTSNLPGKASNPTPADDAVDISKGTTTVSWTAGSNADSYILVFSWYGGVSSVTTTDTEYNFSTWTPLYFDPLKYGTTYTWRVDSVNDVGITTGDTWTFKTLSLDYPRSIYYYPGTGFYYLIWDDETDTWGDPPPVGTIDVDYTVVTYVNFIASHRKLVAASADQLWYESV